MINPSEFFKILKLLNGLNDDFELGINYYNSFKKSNIMILNLLFSKALKFDKRHRFIKYFDLNYTSEQLTGKNINKIIRENGNNSTYKKILLKIMTP